MFRKYHRELILNAEKRRSNTFIRASNNSTARSRTDDGRRSNGPLVTIGLHEDHRNPGGVFQKSDVLEKLNVLGWYTDRARNESSLVLTAEQNSEQPV
ncbi:hypothetical protein M514_25774 [Trichuris suis]|uniref:Uncharacterized protein n=1 Tax=Trichuris suis TaxID=68888 RepID=A0A085MXV9_9BILA|nr:hypothetical protein M514_25774 [Trichuris suis]